MEMDLRRTLSQRSASEPGSSPQAQTFCQPLLRDWRREESGTLGPDPLIQEESGTLGPDRLGESGTLGPDPLEESETLGPAPIIQSSGSSVGWAHRKISCYHIWCIQ